jgi:translation elongation factor P/translation initiation factor 5A
MKKLSTYLFLFILSFSMSSHADDIKEFEIEGISIGDSLLNHLSKEEIITEIEVNKSTYNYLNNDFGEVYSFNKFETYDSLSFFVKPNDEKFLIYEVQGLISYIEDLNGCHIKQNEIVEEISDLLEDAKKSEQSFKSRADPSGKSTKDKIKFTFNSGDEIQVNCTNWEENLRIKNNWTEGLSVIISTNGVLNWLRGN